MAHKRILLATWPFGATGRKPLELLEQTGWELIFNPHHRRLRPHDVADLLHDIDGVIAGTEPYNSETLCNAKGKNRRGLSAYCIWYRYIVPWPILPEGLKGIKNVKLFATQYDAMFLGSPTRTNNVQNKEKLQDSFGNLLSESFERWRSYFRRINQRKPCFCRRYEGPLGIF